MPEIISLDSEQDEPTIPARAHGSPAGVAKGSHAPDHATRHDEGADYMMAMNLVNSLLAVPDEMLLSVPAESLSGLISRLAATLHRKMVPGD